MVIVAAVSVWPNALMNWAFGNSTIARLITSTGIGAAPYVMTWRLLISCSVEVLVVHQHLEHCGNDHSAVGSLSLYKSASIRLGSNWRWIMSLRPP